MTNTPAVAVIEEALHTGVCGPDNTTCCWTDTPQPCTDVDLTALAAHVNSALVHHAINQTQVA